MTITTFQIDESVGLNGKNKADDVRVVQDLLRQCNEQPGESTLDPGPVNGVCTARTITAIKTFQKRFLRGADGRVDPEGQTIQKLRHVTYNDGGVCVPQNHTGRSLASLLLTKLGQKYVFGAAVAKDNMNWIGPWDCAEFVAWGIFQLTGRTLGCRSSAAPNGIRYWNSYTGYFAEDLPLFATKISADEAAYTIGAIALRPPTSKRVGHIAVSRGNNSSIEAYDTQHGVISTEFLKSNRGWGSYWKLDFLMHEHVCSFI